MKKMDERKGATCKIIKRGTLRSSFFGIFEKFLLNLELIDISSSNIAIKFIGIRQT